MACRFPGGARTPQAFWQVLSDGIDAISEVPSDRWNVQSFYAVEAATPGRMSTRWGGFIEAVDQFDADFFGISPREAVSMDPQQRLVLEVGWEALRSLAAAGAGGSPSVQIRCGMRSRTSWPVPGVLGCASTCAVSACVCSVPSG